MRWCVTCFVWSVAPWHGGPSRILSSPPSPAIIRADHSLNTSPAALFKAVLLSWYHFSIFRLYSSYNSNWHGRLSYQLINSFMLKTTFKIMKRCFMLKFSITYLCTTFSGKWVSVNRHDMHLCCAHHHPSFIGLQIGIIWLQALPKFQFISYLLIMRFRLSIQRLTQTGA